MGMTLTCFQKVFPFSSQSGAHRCSDNVSSYSFGFIRYGRDAHILRRHAQLKYRSLYTFSRYVYKHLKDHVLCIAVLPCVRTQTHLSMYRNMCFNLLIIGMKFFSNPSIFNIQLFLREFHSPSNINSNVCTYISEKYVIVYLIFCKIKKIYIQIF